MSVDNSPRTKARIFACENGLFGDGAHPQYCEGCYLKDMRARFPELFKKKEDQSP